MLSFIIYFTLALLVLIGLTAAILNIGRDMAACPISGPTAKAASKVIAVGYLAVGLGGVVLGGLAVPLVAYNPQIGVLLGLGLACLSLGLGFTQAMASLRQAADQALLLLQPKADVDAQGLA
ncbi:MAG: hypothetical protein AAF386_12780 [Pseudomonadota bacterium]